MMDDFAQEVPWAASASRDSEEEGLLQPEGLLEKLGAWASVQEKGSRSPPNLGSPGREARSWTVCLDLVWVPRLQGPGFQPAGLCLSQIATCSSRNGTQPPRSCGGRNGQPLAVPLEVNSVSGS